MTALPPAAPQESNLDLYTYMHTDVTAAVAIFHAKSNATSSHQENLANPSSKKLETEFFNRVLCRKKRSGVSQRVAACHFSEEMAVMGDSERVSSENAFAVEAHLPPRKGKLQFEKGWYWQ